METSDVSINADSLTNQVKRKLNITWTDTDTDARIADIIDSAKSVISFKLGITDNAYDYSTSGIVNMLFLAYCLYLYNHAENEFETNYISEIMQARSLFEVGEE